MMEGENRKNIQLIIIRSQIESTQTSVFATNRLSCSIANFAAFGLKCVANIESRFLKPLSAISSFVSARFRRSIAGRTRCLQPRINKCILTELRNPKNRNNFPRFLKARMRLLENHGNCRARRFCTEMNMIVCRIENWISIEEICSWSTTCSRFQERLSETLGVEYQLFTISTYRSINEITKGDTETVENLRIIGMHRVEP
jgi:hypothetical protein